MYFSRNYSHECPMVRRSAEMALVLRVGIA